MEKEIGNHRMVYNLVEANIKILIIGQMIRLKSGEKDWVMYPLERLKIL